MNVEQSSVKRIAKKALLLAALVPAVAVAVPSVAAVGAVVGAGSLVYGFGKCIQKVPLPPTGSSAIDTYNIGVNMTTPINQMPNAPMRKQIGAAARLIPMGVVMLPFVVISCAVTFGVGTAAIAGRVAYRVVKSMPIKPFPAPKQQPHTANCPICLDDCDTMLTTKCGHEFCLDCFKRHYEYTGHKVTNIQGTCECPMCRAVVVGAEL